MDENIIKMICSEMNRYLNNYQMSKLNKALYKRLDSNDIVEKFRRTLVTRAIDKGMPIELVQHLLGHYSI